MDKFIQIQRFAKILFNEARTVRVGEVRFLSKHILLSLAFTLQKRPHNLWSLSFH